ncbi:hypothetical protein GGI43DRAFT_421583 [Trichoderma evansii]
MHEGAFVGFRALQGILRLWRSGFVIGILIMNSVFLGMMNSHDLPVNQSIVIVEGFAAAGAAWSCIDLGFTLFSGFCVVSLIVIPVEAFMVGCYIFIATVYKPALGDCKGYADTPFGDIMGVDGLTSVRDPCGMQTANFALSIIAAILSGGCILIEFINGVLRCASDDGFSDLI